jgi:hypothetical protein
MFGGGDKKKTADPLLGEVHPQNTAPYGPSPPDKSKAANDTKTSALTEPIIPAPTSNAYLASLSKPLPGGKTLAINDGQAPGAFQMTASSEPLVRPVPRDPAFANGAWGPPTNGSADTFRPPSSHFVDPQVALLQSRGVTQHRVEPLQDGRVRLTAALPQRDNVGQLRTFEVTASDFPQAVQAILQQIDQAR